MDSNIKPVQSAEIPVISSHVAKLVKAIDDGKTCDEIFDTLARMADTTRENDQYIPSKSLRTAFESDGSNGNPLRILLHTIPRKLLRSLALGLLAYDFYDKSSENHENHYSTGGPGTYAIGLTCEGRGGAFLSRREIVELRTCLKEYYCGFKVWQRHGDAYGTSQLTGDEARSYRISMLVDDFFRTEPWDEASGDMPRPALCQGAQQSDKNARSTDNLAWLLSMLKKRVVLGYDGDVHQISSPIQIGCSVEMDKRWFQHDPLKSNLVQSSKLLKLMVGGMKYMGLKPQVCVIPIMKTWLDEQLPLSGILGTVIASSYVTQAGLNVVAPGANTSKVKENRRGVLQENKEEVYLDKPFFSENRQITLNSRSEDRTLKQAIERYDKGKLSVDKLKALAQKRDEIEGDIHLKRLQLERRLKHLDDAAALVDESKETLAVGRRLLGQDESSDSEP
ncbi:uncharacterized protein JN550_008601 [Neoarthrinium moseri]|uniref:uncharacterized protein n=1 Tax=Neoarthrinium moseri TaxID=1658444 RepID=UPI001FDBC220|nr:uncharacterized protein JN550_008601 [Neoarthrinium moseri]KAI1865055.1 hypothetical protein JN550_008601 [Neoarthrinium moseri]